MASNSTQTELERLDISRIYIKVGPIEVEYEGREEFLKSELQGLLSMISNTYKETGIKLDHKETTGILPLNGEDHTSPDKSPAIMMETIQLTTSTIASRLGCKSGPDLVIAACTYLKFVRGLDSFNRQEIINEMRNTPSYFNKNYVKNLTRAFKTLVKTQKMSEISKDKYALTAQYCNELRPLLAK